MLLRGAGMAGEIVIGDQPGGHFQIASVGKQIVAGAVLMLVQEGKLDLHEPVDRWLPDPLPQWRHVTMHHLLTHTAGFPHWDFKTPELDPYSAITCRERLDLLAGTPLSTEPGRKWLYSSPGYLLVGDVFERAAGMPYAEFARERIVARLGLTETHVGQRPATAAIGHRDGAPAKEIDAAGMTGTGDHWTSAGDLSRLVTALHDGELLSPEALGQLCAPHVAIEGHHYGYGVHIGEFDGEPACWHHGDLPGHQSLAVWLQRRRKAIVVLSNEETTDTKAVARYLAGRRD